MIEYVFSCLDALGIGEGPAHSELIMRPAAGASDGELEPVLEIVRARGARRERGGRLGRVGAQLAEPPARVGVRREQSAGRVVEPLRPPLPGRSSVSSQRSRALVACQWRACI